ncbi:MAG: FAD-binding oxidoreductase [Desulfobacterales bacterium]|nr:FAD-binding oxidoreductase [Desulfobacterales bacterium]
MSDIYEALAKIVGKDYVSNQKEDRYFYGRDPGLMKPHEPDYVVMPRTTEEIQQIVRLANKEKTPVVPKGAGLALTGLVIPQKGGIVLDMKRMERILEVNEKARYVIVEGGTTHGVLKSHLQKHYPKLRHSIPDSPPIATVVANAVIHGQGRLTQQRGFNSDMVSGLEVVLPTGEICRIGSCSVSPYWFSKGPPLPDLTGLFLGWFGTTGIITKLALKLYPCKRIRDVMLFLTDRAELVPDIVLKLGHTEMMEDIVISTQPIPLRFRGNFFILVFITGDSEEEIEFKTKMAWDTLWEYFDSRDGGFVSITPDMKAPMMAMPSKDTTRFADVRKGGGFEYSGPIAPVDRYPDFVRKLEELASDYNLSYASAARVINGGHCMMFSFSYTFNRADPDEMDRAKKALDEAAEFSLEQGGVIWKPNIDEQKMMMARMDPNTLELMGKLKGLLDPNGIMNPGNWEAK